MENKIYKICEDILEITEKDVEELREIIQEQKEYTHPFKNATTAWQHKLAEHNEKVLNTLLALKSELEISKKITKPN